MTAWTDAIAARGPSTEARVYAGVVAGALVLSLAFSERLAAYWAHYRLGTAGGNGMALVLVALPGSFALGGVLGTLVARRALRRGASPRLAFGRALLAVAFLLTVLLAAEIWRTRDLRLSQDEAASLPVRYEALAV